MSVPTILGYLFSSMGHLPITYLIFIFKAFHEEGKVSMGGRNQDSFSQDGEIKEGHIALEGPWMLSSDPCEGLNLHPCQPLHAERSLPGLAT